MSDAWLVDRFTEQRPRLFAVALRMLGSPDDADDAVQEAWLRLSRSGSAQIDNLGGWLTTVVARIALDMLRARSRRREDLLEDGDEAAASGDNVPDPEQEALLGDAIGPALLVVLDSLAPAERTAYVLHDLFALSFEEIAPILGRSPAAARQLASRARKRLRGASAGQGSTRAAGERERRRRIVEAFLAASRNGDFEGLLALLHPEVEVRADRAAAAMGAEALVRGAPAVATAFRGRAKAAQLALLDGEPGAIWSLRGEPKVAFVFKLDAELITRIELVADAQTLSALDIEPWQARTARTVDE